MYKYFLEKENTDPTRKLLVINYEETLTGPKLNHHISQIVLLKLESENYVVPNLSGNQL